MYVDNYSNELTYTPFNSPDQSILITSSLDMNGAAGAFGKQLADSIEVITDSLGNTGTIILYRAIDEGFGDDSAYNYKYLCTA